LGWFRLGGRGCLLVPGLDKQGGKEKTYSGTDERHNELQQVDIERSVSLHPYPEAYAHAYRHDNEKNQEELVQEFQDADFYGGQSLKHCPAPMSALRRPL
jgi:hypothetical protein